LITFRDVPGTSLHKEKVEIIDIRWIEGLWWGWNGENARWQDSFYPFSIPGTYHIRLVEEKKLCTG
jgi:hypothetical protein